MARLKSLPLFHRIEGQTVLVLGDGEAAEAKKRLVERAGGVIETDMQRAVEAGAQLAFVALEDAQACESAAADLSAAGMLVNVTDMPDLCDFTVPSVLDRDPVLIAVGTGGASAGLAKHLRLRLERILPQSLGALATALFGAREKLRERFPAASDRRRALDDALREGGALDVLDPAANERVDAWLARSTGAAPSRTEVIVLTSDDPEELTLRQARLLGEADVLQLDGDIPEAILSRARADAVRLQQGADMGEFPGLTLILKMTNEA
ncbi:NAD(P)-dependent oxidoreductase [Altererythrobacter sp.]|uniref:precorrin-2 dehydrogenase/sirohydrochlorin ferrochelatase family protein n=1 Tax=Altererythrobacter sp. TaxID=1872480 RepID=UPI003D00DC96